MTAGTEQTGVIISSHGGDGRRGLLGQSPASRLPPMESSTYRAALREQRWGASEERLSVYIHLPFCASRCLTCDQHSNITHDSQEIDRYLDHVEEEMRLVTEALTGRPALQQLHLGGGTPNYLSDTQLARLMEIVDRHFVIDEHTEASLDANAHRATPAQLGLLHGLGFRTLNLEVYELNPAVLKAVGRAESLSVIEDVIDNARGAGFDTIGAELRYGLPKQTASSIVQTLKDLLSVGPDRISCYAHTRHEDSFEHQRAIDAREMPSLADKVAMFSRIVDTLCDRDYEWIGLDHFAHRGDSLARAQRRGELRRNSIGYSATGGRRVLGFGINSVSDLASVRVRNHPGLQRWHSALARGELPVANGEAISPTQRARRDALSDLLCNLQSDNVEPLFGKDGPPAMRALVEDGLVEIGNNRVSLTDSGRFALHRMYGESATDPQWWDCVA